MRSKQFRAQIFKLIIIVSSKRFKISTEHSKHFFYMWLMLYLAELEELPLKMLS